MRGVWIFVHRLSVSDSHLTWHGPNHYGPATDGPQMHAIPDTVVCPTSNVHGGANQLWCLSQWTILIVLVEQST